MGVFKEREGLPLLANHLGFLINNDNDVCQTEIFFFL